MEVDGELFSAVGETAEEADRKLARKLRLHYYLPDPDAPNTRLSRLLYGLPAFEDAGGEEGPRCGV